MKNLLLFTLGLIIGAGVFYFFCERSKQRNLPTINEKSIENIFKTGKIDTELAEKMINAYQQLPVSDLLVGTDNNKLKGFFIPKENFEEIFLNEKADGIYFNLAMDEEFIDKIPKVNALTLVYSGAVLNRTKSNSYEPDFHTSNQFYDRIEPCPPFCN